MTPTEATNLEIKTIRLGQVAILAFVLFIAGIVYLGSQLSAMANVEQNKPHIPTLSNPANLQPAATVNLQGGPTL